MTIWIAAALMFEVGAPASTQGTANQLRRLDFGKILMGDFEVIIQHEPADVAMLPAFPKAAE